VTNRENVLRALRREQPERVPFEFQACPAIAERLAEVIGTTDYQGYFGFPIRYVEPVPTRQRVDYSRYYRDLPPNVEPLSWAPEWGVLGKTGSVAHFQEMLHPMAEFRSVADIDAYPFPDFEEPYRWEGLSERVRALQRQDLVAVAAMQMTVFETAWYLRGMDTFLVDMMANVEFAEVLMDRITDIRVTMARRYAQADLDILQLGDDVATQLEMMIDPALWRALIQPRLSRVVKAAKAVNPDLLLFYHGDGNMMRIVPDLVELGIDVLNPVQPECMDPVEVKRRFGDRLAQWGTLGTQSTLPFGTVAEVRETCRRLIREVGAGGGLLLSPTHVVEPEVPIENLLAFIETVKEAGAEP